jgi:hypothetical protein
VNALQPDDDLSKLLPVDEFDGFTRVYYILSDAETIDFAAKKASVIRMRAARDAGDERAYQAARTWTPSRETVLSWFPTAKERTIQGRCVPLVVIWDDFVAAIEAAARG